MFSEPNCFSRYKLWLELSCFFHIKLLTYPMFEGNNPHKFKLGSGSYLPLPPPFSLLKKPPLEGSALNTQVVIFSSDVYAKNVCTNKPFHAQLHSVIYLVTLSNNKNPNRSPSPNSIRKHGAWNTGTVHEVNGVKLIAHKTLPQYLEGETLMPADIPHICKDAVP